MTNNSVTAPQSIHCFQNMQYSTTFYMAYLMKHFSLFRYKTLKDNVAICWR